MRRGRETLRGREGRESERQVEASRRRIAMLITTLMKMMLTLLNSYSLLKRERGERERERERERE